MKHVFIFLALLLTEIAQAQTLSKPIVIEGVVINSNTNEPIYKASAYIIGTTIGTQTDKLGRFRFEIPDTFLVKKEIKLSCIYPGFLRDTYDVKISQPHIEVMISLLERHSSVLTNFDVYSITGYTIDKVTHLPISGVRVNMKGDNKIVFSTDNGWFSCSLPKTIRNDKLVVCFSKKGYRKQRISISEKYMIDEFIVRL